MTSSNSTTLMGSVRLYLGSTTGPSESADQLITSVGAGGFGGIVATVGDLNGDGFGDIALAAPLEDGGRVYVYYGSEVGLVDEAALNAPDGPDSEFGSSVAAAGDVNLDGYADMVVGAPGAASSGRAYVYLGSAAGVAESPYATLTPPGADEAFGTVVSSFADANGDRRADILVSAPGANGGVGSVYVFVTEPGGFVQPASTTLVGPGPAFTGFGYAMVASDVDNNGYTDVLVGARLVANGEGRVYAYRGQLSGLPATPSQTLVGVDGENARFGSSLGIGDVDADGYEDLLIAANGFDVYTGRVHFYRGSSAGLPMVPSQMFDESGASSGEFRIVAGVGDVNGDGFSDVGIGAPGRNSFEGRVGLYPGGTNGIQPTELRIVLGPDGEGQGFGTSIAGIN